ncbi:MAG: DUF5915 domain-containing protein, partial [Tissierellales bacterium]
GSKVKSFAKALNELDSHEVVKKLEENGKIIMNLDGEDVEIMKDYITVTISAKEGFDVAMENNLFVILDTTLTKDLLNEGYAREFISKVQQMRKANGYDVLDNINIYYDGDDEIKEAVELFEDYIKSETLAVSITRVKDDSFEKQDLNGHMTCIKLDKLEE